MARNRGKKALYEVMSKARVKPEHGTIVEQSRPKKTVEEAPAPRHKESAGAAKSTAKWWKKPRIVQFNAGRIEFSMPYQIAVVLLLGFIFVIIAAYRLGQSSYPIEQKPQAEQSEPVQRETEGEKPVENATTDIMKSLAPAQDTTAETEVAEPVEPTGNNVIVLAQYNSLPDLAAVQTYFDKFDIELEIVPEAGQYFLQTKQRYDNPSKPGTDGYRALQKIKEIGKGYKAPKGYETFASNLFQDAYGKKVQ